MKQVCVVAVAVLLVAGGSVFARDEVVTSIVQDSGMYAAVASGNSNRGDGGRYDLGPTVAGDGFLITFDLSGVVLAAGESISAASMEMFFARGTGIPTSPTNSLDIVAGDLVLPWVEGVGNAGASGDLGYPWGPATVGDAVFNYQTVTAAALDVGFGKIVATAGTAWNVAGGRGVGTDVNVLIVDDNISYVGGSIAMGNSFGSVDFTAAGVGVLEAWIAGTQDNFGMSVWTKDTSTGYTFPIASREHSVAPVASAPVLTLTIVPEPATMGLLGLGFAGLTALRRRRRK